MKINKLNESVEHPYMFQYSCNNPTFGYDFQRYAQELGARRMYDHTQRGGGMHFYTVPSEDVYNKLKEVAKKRFTVEMYPLRPFDKERYVNAKVQEAMTIAYSEDTIKMMISQLEKEIEDYKQLIIDEPEDKDYWEEEIKKCQDEIADLKTYKPLDEAAKQEILYVIKDSHGNQLSAPNPDDGELWDRVASMEARGRRGLCVVVYTGKKVSEALDDEKSADTNYLEESAELQHMNESQGKVKLFYPNLQFNVQVNHIENPEYGMDWDDAIAESDVELEVDKEDIVNFLIEEKLYDFMPELDDFYSNENGVIEFVNNNFDELFTKYMSDILEYFKERAIDTAERDFYGSSSMNESAEDVFITVYSEDSYSGPEEGGYTSWGWRPIRSRKFNSVDEAKKKLQELVADEEILHQSEDSVHTRDDYGDEYIYKIETSNNRGRTETPPLSWTESEFYDQYEIPETFFDDDGRVIDPSEKARRDKEATKQDREKEFLSKLDSVEDVGVLLDIISDPRYDDIRGSHSDKWIALFKELSARKNELTEELDENDILRLKNFLSVMLDENIFDCLEQSDKEWAEAEVRSFIAKMEDRYIEENLADDFGDRVYLSLDRVPDESVDKLQLSHEIAADLDKFFRNNKLWLSELHYNQVDDRIEFDINWGDWKHEHLRAKWLLEEFFENLGARVEVQSYTTEEDGSDTYSAHYQVFTY